MKVLKKHIFYLILLFSISLHADLGISSNDIEARIAELSALSVRSGSGNFIVVGTNRVESFALGSWCDNAVKQIESITGLSVPFNNHRINLIVGDYDQNIPGGAVVRYSASGRGLISRVYLESYDVAYERRGRQATCCAILAGYTGGSPDRLFSLPPWLWKGIEQNILFDVRSRNMEQVLSDWRSGTLRSARDIVGGVDRSKDASGNTEVVESQKDLAEYSVFVRWLSSRSNKKEIFRTLFSSANYITVSGLQSLVVDDDSEMTLDEAWDRWLLRQSRVVRSFASVSTRVIDQLRSELLLYPGTYGIPLAGEIPQGSSFVKLITFRNADWIPQYVNRKRSRLNSIAAGHKGGFVQVVGLFDEFLSDLEKDVPDILLLKQLRDANAALTRLAEKVEGGVKL